MSEHGNNATPPSPAIAPGSEQLDPAAIAAGLGARPGGSVDARILAAVPRFNAPFFQAGLAGYSDAAMRIIARRHGCPFCITEALLDRTLLAGGRGFTKADLGDLHDNIPGGSEDHPLACQIMGSDPAEMAAAALKVAEQGRRGDKEYRRLAYEHLSRSERAEVFDLPVRAPTGDRPESGLASGTDSCEDVIDEINSLSTHPFDSAAPIRAPVLHSARPELRFEVIDVNLACPVKKIKSKARGGHWLAEPEGAIRILEAVREAIPASIPCTLKIRRSFDDTPEMVDNFERIFSAAYSIGYAWSTVHARTVQQKYIGPSRWTFLRDLVRRHPDKVIFGSGDIWDVHDIFRMIGYTGVHAVSVARGCIGNPWIFRQAREMLAGRPPLPPTISEQRAALEEHFRISAELHGEQHAGKMMRKFGIRFATHHPRSEEVRQRFIAITTLEGWKGVLDEHYGPAASRPSDGSI